ncbi:MAG: phosphatase PAP2 family protein [Gemmatimonadota bacterium]
MWIRLQRLAPGLVILSAFVAPLTGQGGGDPNAADGEGPLFETRDALVAGAFGFGTGVAFTVDAPVTAAFRAPSVQQAPGLQEAAWTLNHLAVPGAFLISAGLYGAGRMADDPELTHVGLHMGGSVVVATAATYVVKALAGRQRPAADPADPFDFRLGRGIEGRRYRAFPSGHTAIAFAAAAAAARELDRSGSGHELLVGALTYGPAALVGAARVFDSRHWPSDVVAGAAIGVFAGWKTVDYAHRRSGNLLDRWFLGASVAPGDPGSFRVLLLPAF